MEHGNPSLVWGSSGPALRFGTEQDCTPDRRSSTPVKSGAEPLTRVRSESFWHRAGLFWGMNPLGRAGVAFSSSLGTGWAQDCFGSLQPELALASSRGESSISGFPAAGGGSLGGALTSASKPQERDRLKQIGRLGKGKAVKVVKNDEDGTKRGGNPR